MTPESQGTFWVNLGDLLRQPKAYNSNEVLEHQPMELEHLELV